MRQGAPFLSGLARILTRDGLCAGAADRVAFRVIAAPALLSPFPAAPLVMVRPLGRGWRANVRRPGPFLRFISHAVPRELMGPRYVRRG